ncbi:MAG: hypothetical protein GY853_04340 [PVC group bacterium]|nr:hypothetical protein [PVC group bacterium]
MSTRELPDKRKKISFLLLIVVILFCIPFFWSSPNHYNLGGDDSRLYLYSPYEWLHNVALYSWFDISGISSYNPQQFSFPFVILLALLQKIFFFLNIQKLAWGLTLSFGFFSIYLFIEELLQDKNNLNSTISAAIGGLLYVFFPLIFYIDWPQPLYNLYAIAVFPSFLWFFLKAVNNADVRYLLGGAVVSALFSLVIVNFPWFLPFAIGAFIFLVLYCFLIEENKGRLGFYLLLYVLFSILFNLFWIIPLLHSILFGGFASEATVGGGVKEAALNVIHSVAPSMNIFDTLCGLLSRELIFGWNWPQKVIAKYTFNFSAFSALLPGVIFLSLLIRQGKVRTKKLLVIFSLITVILAYLQTVNIGGWGVKLFDWLIYTVPWWTMLRNFFSKVPIAYGIFFSITIGIAVFHVLERINKQKIKRIFVAGLIVVILVQALPFIFGRVNALPVYNADIPLNRNIIVPDYYRETTEYIKKLRVGRVLTLPMTFATWSIFKSSCGKGLYVGSSPIKVFTGKDDFNGKMGFERISGLPELIIDAYQKDANVLGYVFGKLGVRYMLYNTQMEKLPEVLKTGWLWEYETLSNNKSIKSILSSVANERLAVFGPLEIYKINDEFFLPHIYPAKKASVVKGDISALMSLSEGIDLDKSDVLFFEKNETTKGKGIFSDEGRIEGGNNPEIVFKKINPTKFSVEIKNAKHPFWLVFNERFHEDWNIYKTQISDANTLRNDELSSYSQFGVKESEYRLQFAPQDFKFLFLKPMDLQHKVANAYANAWYIEPENFEKSNNFSFVIYFLPQSFFYLGLLISVFSMLLSVIFMIVYSIKRRS